MSTLFNKDIIVIVGGFSSGCYIAPLFNGLGYRCVHVCTEQVKEHPLLKPTFNPTDYSENHVLASEEDASDFVRKMHGRRVKALIAGCEPCVQLADKLGEMFDTARNVGTLSWARRSKYLMHDTLKRNGLKSARQLLSDSLQEIFDFHDQIGGKIVLKPEASSNTDSVVYCSTREQIAEAADRILGVKNYFGLLNTKVLVQEYLSGKQYLVNTLSSDGHHYVCDAWGEVRDNDDGPSNDSYADLIRQNSDVHSILSQYTSHALDALGIRYGAAHFEIRMSDEGPCLVEVGARMSGGVDFSVLHGISSLTQLSLLTDAMLDTETFLTRIRATRQSTKSVRKVYLSSGMSGEVLSDPHLDLFLDIDSVSSIFFRPVKGGNLHKTVRSQNVGRPGHLYMVGDDQDAIVRDYERVRLNETLLYEAMLRAPSNEAR